MAMLLAPTNPSPPEMPAGQGNVSPRSTLVLAYKTSIRSHLIIALLNLAHLHLLILAINGPLNHLPETCFSLAHHLLPGLTLTPTATTPPFQH